jgi:hypothetical protein
MDEVLKYALEAKPVPPRKGLTATNGHKPKPRAKAKRKVKNG